jgi:DNA-directed RNA polymerase specialized sigma24 family protein
VLHDAQWGYRRIAAHQRVSVTMVRDRIRNAVRKMAQAQAQEDAG